MTATPLLLLLFLGSSAAGGENPWYVHYEAGLRQIDEGRPEVSETAEETETESSSYLDYERAPETISQEELERLEKLVLSRCGLHKDTDAARAPWYFHYELAQELERRGDPQRALDALIEATRRRPRPRRGARMYGMWFTDYLPYYRIAKVHAALGNWDCVVDALRVAESLGEVRSDDREFDEYVMLREEAEARR